MTARIGYLTALTGAAVPSAGGRGTLRPPRRLFGGFPDAGFQEEPAIWRDASKPLDVRIDDLVRRMSLAEKVSQL